MKIGLNKHVNNRRWSKEKVIKKKVWILLLFYIKVRGVRLQAIKIQ